MALGAGDLYSIAIYNTGDIMAGDISLEGHGSGVVQNDGLLDASNLNGAGGTVVMTGQDVAHTGTIDVSGSNGGGEAYVGGGYQGSDPALRNARYNYTTGTINADATLQGDGGTVVVWADNATQFSGAINARGGMLSGDGGMVEVSGKGTLGFSGLVDTTAAMGQTGTLLLDPTDITISLAASTATMSFNGGTFTYSDTTASPSNLNTGDLVAQLNTTNVTVSTTSGLGDPGDIDVNNNVAWNSANTLTLDADNDINVTVGVTIANDGTGGVVFEADNDVNLNGVISLNGGSFTAGVIGGTAIGGNFVRSATGVITTNGGAVEIATDGSVTISGAITNSGAVDIEGDTGINLGADISTNNGNVRLRDAVTMTGNSTVGTSAGAGDIQFDSTVDGAFDLVVNAGSGAGGGSVTMTGAVGTVGADLASLSVTGSTINLASIGDGATGVTGNTTVTAGTALNLTGTAYNSDGSQSYNGGGNTINLTNAGGATFTTSGDAISFSNNGNIALTGDLTVAVSSGTVTVDGNITGNGAANSAVDIQTAAGSNIILNDITAVGQVNLATSGAGQINFDAIDSDNNAGVTISNGTGQILAGGAITTDGGVITITSSGTVQLSGNLDSTQGGAAGGAISFAGAGGTLQINEDISIITDGAGGGDPGITINKVVQGQDADEILTLDAGDGSVLVSQTVGAAIRLGGFVVSESGDFQNTASIQVDGATGIVINANDGVDVDANISTSNDLITIDADVDNNGGTGDLDVADGTGIDTNGGALTITANDLNLNTTGALASDAGDTTIVTSDGGDIDLGADNASGGMVVEDVELGNITAATLNLQSTGDATVDSVTAANTGNIGTIDLDVDNQIYVQDVASVFDSAVILDAGLRVRLQEDISTQSDKYLDTNRQISRHKATNIWTF